MADRPAASVIFARSIMINLTPRTWPSRVDFRIASSFDRDAQSCNSLSAVGCSIEPREPLPSHRVVGPSSPVMGPTGE
jgi:hypothetical protein